jgi:hypothetical protein
LNLTVSLYGTAGALIGTFDSDGYYGSQDGTSVMFDFTGATFAGDSVYQLAFSSLHPIAPPDCDNTAIEIDFVAGTDKDTSAVYFAGNNRWLTSSQWSNTTELVTITCKVCDPDESSSDST